MNENTHTIEAQLAAYMPAATIQAAEAASSMLMRELAQKMAANMALASELQRARSAVAASGGHLDLATKAAKAAQESGAVARAKLDVTHDALAAVFGHKGEDKADLETLLDRAKAAAAALDNLQNFRAAVCDIVDEGRLLTTTAVSAPDAELLTTLEAIIKGARVGEPAIGWGLVTRLRAIMGHLRGNRLPSAIGLLDAVIDELISSVEPPAPENEDELAEATAADLKIKENKENP
jgi:hypothetical protein